MVKVSSQNVSAIAFRVTPAPAPAVAMASAPTPKLTLPPAPSAVPMTASVMVDIAKPRGRANSDIEQIQREPVEPESSRVGTETPAPTRSVIQDASPNAPTLPPAAAAVTAKSAALGKADWKDEVSRSLSDISGSSTQPAEPDVAVVKAPVTTSTSDLAATHTSNRRAVADPSTPPTGSTSDQNVDIRNSMPAQVPVSSSATELVIQPVPFQPVPLQIVGSVAAALPIRADVAFSPNIGDLAFAARIKPAGVPGQPSAHAASAPNSMSYADTASQSVKAAGQANTKEENDPDCDEQQNAAPPASSSSLALGSSTAKPSFRKEDVADSTANVVAPTPVPPAQAVMQPANAVVPAESALTAKAAPAAAVAAPPETTHVLLDKPSQATAPARNISLQVEGASGQTVDIRIASRSGDLNVAVRAGDENVAQNLRQGLDDLETHLAQNGYHADTWHPGHSGLTTEPAAPASSSSNSSSHQQSQSGPGSQQNRGQRDNNPSNRPRWVNELASSLKTQSTEKGNENGIST